MTKKIAIVLLLTALVFSGCKSLFTREGNLLSAAHQADAGGDYKSAVLNAVESIRIDNLYVDAIEFLKDVYPRANNYYALKIDEKRSSGGSFANDSIALYYANLKAINEAVRTLPPITDPKTKMQLSLRYTDYSAELEVANSMAAEDHYQEGLKLLKMKGRENAKSAATEFETAMKFVPGYKDAARRAEAALENATQILAFFPFVNNAWNIPTAQFSDIVQNRTIANLLKDPAVMKFTRIVDRQMQDRIMQEQLGSLNALMDDKSRVEIGQLLNANILITGTIDSAELEGPQTAMTQYKRSTEIEVEEPAPQEGYYKNGSSDSLTYYKDGSAPADQTLQTPATTTEKVYADVFVYRKTITFKVTVSYKAVDVESGTILKNDTVTVTSEDSAEWAEWSGNEAALTWDDKQLIDTYEEAVKSAQQIATDAAEEAGNRIAAGLAEFLI